MLLTSCSVIFLLAIAQCSSEPDEERLCITRSTACKGKGQERKCWDTDTCNGVDPKTLQANRRTTQLRANKELGQGNEDNTAEGSKRTSKLAEHLRQLLHLVRKAPKEDPASNEEDDVGERRDATEHIPRGKGRQGAWQRERSKARANRQGRSREDAAPTTSSMRQQAQILAWTKRQDQSGRARKETPKPITALDDVGAIYPDVAWKVRMTGSIRDASEKAAGSKERGDASADLPKRRGRERTVKASTISSVRRKAQKRQYQSGRARKETHGAEVTSAKILPAVEEHLATIRREIGKKVAPVKTPVRTSVLDSVRKRVRTRAQATTQASTPETPPDAKECMDEGPFKCRENNCPAALLTCLHMAKYCTRKFKEVFTIPPAGTHKLYIYEKCPKTCKVDARLRRGCENTFEST